MKILRFLVALSVLYGSSFGQSLDRRALDTNAFYTTIVNAQNPNGGGVDSKYWTNQSGLYRYQPGTGNVVVGQPGPSLVLRKDGSAFVGTNVFQDVIPTATGTYFPYVVSMTDSNEPTTIHADWWAIDSEAYGVYGGASLTVQQGGASTLTLSGDTGVNQSFISFNANPGSSFIKLNNNTDRFIVGNDGDLDLIKSVTYSWPTTNGSASQVLTSDGGSPQQLYWTTASGGAAGTNSVAVAAGTNITAVTNSGLVTVSVTGLTNTINALVTNSINQNARIGPGTTNFIPLFINSTNVSDSRVAQVQTNEWDWNIRTNSAANTNSFTNRIYSAYTSAANNQGLMIVAQPPGSSLPNEIGSFRGSGNTIAHNKLQFQESWFINGIGAGGGADGAGHWLPVVTDALDIGTTSSKVRDISISRCFIGTPRNDTVIFSSGFGGQGFGISTAGALYFTGPGLAGIQFNSADAGGACLDMKLYPIGFGASISNVQSTLRWPGIAGLVGIGTNSSVASPTAVGIGASPASGTDKGAPDTILYGGTSTGAGKNGDIRFKTANPAASSSTVNTLIDRVLITTNTFTIYSNLVVNGTINSSGFSGNTSNSIFQLFDTPGGIYLSSYGTNSTTTFGTNAADSTTITNGTVKISTSLSVSNITASRMVMSGADKILTAAAASGAVPVNADGSATTFAQVSALGLRPAGVAGVMGVIPFITASTKFIPPFGATVLSATTETNCSQSMPFSCTWSNMYVRFNSLGTGTNCVITLVTNGVASSLTVSVNGPNGIALGNDTTHGVVVAAGSTVSISVLGNNASANGNNVMISCGFYQ